MSKGKPVREYTTSLEGLRKIKDLTSKLERVQEVLERTLSKSGKTDTDQLAYLYLDGLSDIRTVLNEPYGGVCEKCGNTHASGKDHCNEPDEGGSEPHGYLTRGSSMWAVCGCAGKPTCPAYGRAPEEETPLPTVSSRASKEECGCLCHDPNDDPCNLCMSEHHPKEWFYGMPIDEMTPRQQKIARKKKPTPSRKPSERIRSLRDEMSGTKKEHWYAAIIRYLDEVAE